jgi:hypothetical protein
MAFHEVGFLEFYYPNWELYARQEICATFLTMPCRCADGGSLNCIQMKTMQSDQELKPVYKRSYLLRLWREDHVKTANWRVTLEDLHTRERFGFASLEQMFAFLMDLSECNGDKKPGEDKNESDNLSW